MPRTSAGWIDPLPLPVLRERVGVRVLSHPPVAQRWDRTLTPALSQQTGEGVRAAARADYLFNSCTGRVVAAAGWGERVASSSTRLDISAILRLSSSLAAWSLPSSSW